MKNRFITICVILAALLSIMSFTAILMPRNARTNTPEDTTEEATKEPVLITFNWDDDGYTVPEGTTFGEFVISQYGEEGSFFQTPEGEYTVVDDYICFCGSPTGVPADGIIRNGESYGFRRYPITSNVNDEFFDCFNGATWEGVVSCSEHDVPFTIDGNGFVENDYGVICYEHDDHNDCSKYFVKATDLIINCYNYSACSR